MHRSFIFQPPFLSPHSPTMRFLTHMLWAAAALTATAACSGEDRAGEQPLEPTVATRSYTVTADSVVLRGEVLTSHNSSIKECGFLYGNDTLRVTLKADEAATLEAPIFACRTGRLDAGRYYALAYARNGMGTAYGDTIYFTIGE